MEYVEITPHIMRKAVATLWDSQMIDRWEDHPFQTCFCLFLAILSCFSLVFTAYFWLCFDNQRDKYLVFSQAPREANRFWLLFIINLKLRCWILVGLYKILKGDISLLPNLFMILLKDWLCLTQIQFQLQNPAGMREIS